MKDYYGILGVPRSASQDEIKQAFRELAKKYHPDRFKGDKKVGETKFKEVHEAYEELLNSERRMEHNTKRAHHAQKSADLHMEISVSYENAELGGEKEVRTPDGHRIVVMIPENMRDGRKIRLEGQGAGGRGDLYVTVRVQTPRDKRERNKVVFVRQIMRELNVDMTQAKKIEEKIFNIRGWKERSVDYLENKNARLSEEIERLRNENVRLRTKASDLDWANDRIRDLRERNEELCNKNLSLEDQNKQLLEEFNVVVSENNDLKHINARLVRREDVIAEASKRSNEYPHDKIPSSPTTSDMSTAPNQHFGFHGNEPAPVPSSDENTRKQPSVSDRIGYVGNHVGKVGKNIFRRRKQR